MTDQLTKKIPEWMSLQDIARAWSEETGEKAETLEVNFREWFKDFLVRNAYTEAGGTGDAGIPAEMLEGRQIWRETFETFCEERGHAKPRFWFPEPSLGRPSAPAAAVSTPGTARFAAADETTAAEDEAASDESAEDKPAPPARRRARVGGASFTRIALALVAMVVLALIALWVFEPGEPVVARNGSPQPGAEQLAAMAPATPLVASDPAPAETGETQTAGLAPADTGESRADAPAPAGTGETQEAGLAPDETSEPQAATPITEETGESQSVAPALAEADQSPSAAPALAEADQTQSAAPEMSSEPDAAAAQLAESGAARPVAPVSTEEADEGLVLLIQRELQTAGFDPGPLDGKSGPRFSSAIAAYQRAHDLSVDGRMSVDLLSRLARENLQQGRVAAEDGRSTARQTALQTPSITERPAPRGRALVHAIQERLAARGYYIGPIDGSLGRKTREAIEIYQRAQRYETNGLPSRALYEELEDYALEVRGLKEFRQGAFDKAILTYSRMIKRQPKDANAFFNRGLAYKNAGFAEQALADYDTAIGLDPSHQKAYLDRGNVRYQNGSYREAVRDYLKAMGLWFDFS